tara:strand:+ start:4651 stop:5016 length:366 start_codon:yes stop_codon:yes gene_type:complete
VKNIFTLVIWLAILTVKKYEAAIEASLFILLGISIVLLIILIWGVFIHHSLKLDIGIIKELAPLDKGILILCFPLCFWFFYIEDSYSTLNLTFLVILSVCVFLEFLSWSLNNGSLRTRKQS